MLMTDTPSPPPAPPPAPKGPVARAAAAAAIVLGCALVLACVFAFGPYYYYLKSSRHSRTHEVANDMIEHESFVRLKSRFWWGAGIGGVLGGLYVATAGRTKDDPSAPPS